MLRLLPGIISLEAGQATRFPCSVLHRTGFVMPPQLPLGRWALNSPFHPYLLQLNAKSGGIFSATLSVNWSFSYQLPAFSCGDAALWCPDFPLKNIKLMSDCLRHFLGQYHRFLGIFKWSFVLIIKPTNFFTNWTSAALRPFLALFEPPKIKKTKAAIFLAQF